jgi:hypothetical protein
MDQRAAPAIEGPASIRTVLASFSEVPLNNWVPAAKWDEKKGCSLALLKRLR